MTGDGYGSDVLELPAIQPRCVCLFAAGRGGEPRRYLGLLKGLVQQGCTVIAPPMPMLSSSVPTKAELEARIEMLGASLEAHAGTGLPMVGLGHSIGATTLLALAGAQEETLLCDKVRPGSKPFFSRLALLAPAADFFRRPGALKSLDMPVKIWTGARDTITPPSQAMFLRDALSAQTPVEVATDELAGHFTYMDQPPPHAVEPHPDHPAFLKTLATEVGKFLIP